MKVAIEITKPRLPPWALAYYRACLLVSVVACLILAAVYISAYCSSIAQRREIGPTPITAFSQENNPWYENRCIMYRTDDDGNRYCAQRQLIRHESWTNHFAVVFHGIEYRWDWRTGESQKVWAVGDSIFYAEVDGCGGHHIQDVTVNGARQ